MGRGRNENITIYTALPLLCDVALRGKRDWSRHRPSWLPPENVAWRLLTETADRDFNDLDDTLEDLQKELEMLDQEAFEDDEDQSSGDEKNGDNNEWYATLWNLLPGWRA